MKTHNIITTLLVILAISLGVSIFLQNKNSNTPVVPETATTTETGTDVVVSTTTVNGTTSTTTKPAEVFPKQVSLSTQNYYEFQDGAILSVKKIEDSRCAANVNCVWAGKVTVTFNVKRGNFSEDFNLDIMPGGTENSTYNYAGYKVALVGVQPDKGPIIETIGQKDYRLTIVITK